MVLKAFLDARLESYTLKSWLRVWCLNRLTTTTHTWSRLHHAATRLLANKQTKSEREGYHLRLPRCKISQDFDWILKRQIHIEYINHLSISPNDECASQIRALMSIRGNKNSVQMFEPFHNQNPIFYRHLFADYLWNPFKPQKVHYFND